jgi:hypothetical protein
MAWRRPTVALEGDLLLGRGRLKKETAIWAADFLLLERMYAGSEGGYV